MFSAELNLLAEPDTFSSKERLQERGEQQKLPAKESAQAACCFGVWEIRSQIYKQVMR